MQQLRILSTKKLPANQRQFLLNAGFSVVDANFISTSYNSISLTEINDLLLFTSQHAVKSILRNPKLSDLKVKTCLCVGSRTKELLQKNGFTVAASFDNATQLAAYITENHKDNSFTFFAGDIRMDVLPNSLQAARLKFNEYKVYKTILTPTVVNLEISGILFFSPSGVKSFLRQNAIQQATCFCIGPTTAKALEKQTNNIVIAKYPTVENTIIQCINHFKNT